MSNFYITAFLKNYSSLKSFLAVFPILLFIGSNAELKAQCTVGGNIADNALTWDAATYGSQTVRNTSGSAGGPPGTVSDYVTVCADNGSVLEIPFTVQFSETNGNVYDRMRSGTNGAYGQPYFTLYMDNFDNGCTSCSFSNNAPYSAGNSVRMLFTFDYPVILSDFEISDIDAADNGNPSSQSSSFQDRVTVSATNATGGNVPVNLVLGQSGLVSISGQTATSAWASGQNYNINPDDARGRITVSTSQPVKSFSLDYIAGPNDTNPAQQAIRVSGIESINAPAIPEITGNVFNDCDGLDDNQVDGGNATNIAGSLYVNAVDNSTNTVLAVAKVNNDGTYSISVPNNKTYSLRLSTNPGTLGSTPPATSLPSGYSYTGEKLGTGTGHDGTPNGILTGIVVGTSDISNANFATVNPVTLTVTPSNVTTCFGGNNGSINLTVNTGPSPFTYSWSNGATTQDISGLTAGSYTVTVTDANGCSTTASTSISEPTEVSLSTTKVDVACNGANTGSIDLSVMGGTGSYTYSWSNGATIQDISGLSEGTYSVTVTDGNGCTATTNVTITEPAAIVATATSSPAACNGENGTAALYATGGDASYTFTSSGGTVTGSTLSAPAGTYTITATDGNSCTGTVSVTITEPEAIVATATPSPADCNGGNGSAALSATGGDNTYTFTSTGGTVSGTTLTAPAGMYTITATDGNSCTGTVSVTITEPAAIVATATPSPADCNGGNGSAALSATGGDNTYTFTSSGGTVSGTTLTAPAGTYTITATDGNSCTGTVSVTITEPAAVAVSATPSPAACNGENGTAALSATGGDASYTFTSTGGTVTGSTLSAPAGTYTITATDGNSCTGTTTVTITEPAAVAVTATPSPADCNGGNGSAALSATGGDNTYTFTSTGGTVSGTTLTAPAGTYTITATDGNSCTGTVSVTITEPAAIVATATPSPADCNGGNGSAALSATGGNNVYTFTSTGGTVSGTTLTAPAGTYTITATDGNSCTGTVSVTITEPAAVAVTATPSPADCNGANGTAALSASGGNNAYTFTSSGGTVSGTTLTAPAGTYTITATDGNSCTGTVSVTITEPAAIVATATPSPADCNGGNGSAALSATGGDNTYTFTSTGGTVSGTTLTAPAGTYTITATDGNSCTGTTTVTITEPAAVAVTATPSPADCNGANGTAALSASGGNNAYTFTSSGGTVSGTTLTAPAGTYTITATDGNSCTGTTTVTITEPAAVAVSATPSPAACNGENGTAALSATGGDASYTFTSTGGTVTGSTLSAPAGTYTITATDGNSCTGTTTVTITEPAAVAVTATPSPADCNGGNGSAALSATGGDNTYTFTSTGGTVSGTTLKAPAGTYTITATDGNSCTGTVSVTITEPAAVAVSATPSPAACNGGNGSAALSATGGINTYTFTSTGGTVSGTTLTAPAGTYTITATDGNSCTGTVSVTITEPAAVAVTATPSPADCNGANGTAALSASGGNNAYTFTSSGGTVSGTTLTAPAGTYTITATDGNSCTGTVSVTITEPDAIVATATPSPADCNGANGSAALSATGGDASYTFTSTGGTVTGSTLSAPAGTYTITATDGNSCTGTVSVTITEPAAIVATATPSPADCNGGNGSAALSATGGDNTYTFTSTGGTVSGTTLTAPAGTYTITATDGNSCTGTVSVTITEPAEELVASASDYTLGCTEMGGDIILTVSGGTRPYSYDWDNDGIGDFDDSKDLLNVSAGTYNVVVRDGNGCITTATAEVIFTACPSLTIVKTQITGQNPVTSPSFLDYEIVVTNTGNVSLTNVVVSDTLPNGTVGTLVGPTGDGLTSGTLDTAEVWTYTISYAVTQADIDAGEILVNKAVVTTEELPTPEEDEATTPVSQTPSLTIVKTQITGQNPVTSPSFLDYEIVVTNTGNVSLTNVVVSDTLPNGTVGTLVGPTGDGLTSGTLDTAEVWTYTISYAVTQADIDAGEILVNKAVVTTEELPTPEEDEATTPVSQTPSLTIVKTQVGGETTVTEPGNIDYEIVVTNTGNVSLTNVVVSDTLPNGTVGTLVGPTGDGLTSGTLDTAEVWTYTISYAVTQADIDAGEILVNKAVVTTEELPTPEEDEATTPVGQTPSLTIVKTQVGGETTVTKPGNIDYEIVVTNTGNVSLTNVVVSDTLPNGTVGTLVGPTGDGLTSGTLDTAEVWTYTISYAVTQADIDAGEALVNKAVVTTEELPTPEEDEATTPVSQTPSLTIVKTQVGGETTVTEPGNIDYEIVVTNTGNVSLTNVVVSDTLPNGTVGTLVGPTGDGLTSGTLDTAEVWTYTISYAVTQADIDAGEILVNKAVVTTEELPTPEEDEATTPVSQTPSLTIVKTQVGGETTVTKPGNIDYEIVVTNTGNVSLTNVVVSDTLPNGTVGTLVGPTGDGLTSGTLDTAEVWTYTISYAVTQADIDAGEALVNKAVVTTEELPTPEEDEATTPVSQTPSLTIVKTQVGGETTVTEPGNIDYEIVVTNTGNVSLTNVVVSDTLPNGTVGTLVGPTGDGLTSGTLDTAEVWTYTISYAVTQADIDAGEALVNKAVVTTEELPTPEEDEATTPVGQTPSLTIVKTQVGGETTVTEPGNIDYEIVVTNTGNVSLTNVVVSDTLPNGTVGTLVGPTGDGLTSGTLDTAEVWTYTISYAVTQADIDAGEILVNKAVVTTEELPTPEEDEATTPVGQTPSLTIVKTQVGGETTVTEPGNIDYEIVVTNTGNVSLTNVVVSDTLPNGTVGTLVGPTGDGLTSGTLDTAEVWTYTISYAVTQADIDAGEILVNKAVVTTEELPTPEEDEATTPVGQTPSLTIVKTQITGQNPVTSPSFLDYEIVVTNTGNVSLTNVVVSDTLPNGTVGTLVGPTGDGLTSGTLDTAEVWTYTISYAVTQADIDAGEALVNKAVVTTEELPTPEEDEATTPVGQTPSLTIVKTQVGGETTVTEPGNIDYEIVVTNTGNVSLTNVVVSDTLPNGTVGTLVGPTGDGLTSGTLDTAEVWTYTISYAVTQADIDAGEALVNKAVVTTEELPTPEEDEATTPVGQTPSLTIVKTQITGQNPVTSPSFLDYEIVVTNTGNVSLTNVVVSDTLPNGTVGTLVGPTGDGLTSGTLDTAEVWTYTISYAVTQADIDAGEALVNKAVVTTEELPTPEEDEATTPVSQTPSLTIVKTQVGGETTVTEPGNIDYEIVVTNTGNVSLTNVVVSDTLPNGTVGTLVGPTGDGLTSGTLDTAEVWTYTISYAVTQADIDAGEILVNKAVVTTEELPTPEEDEATTPVGQTPSLTIVKTQVGGETTVTEPGNIDYEIVVTNTGNVSLTNVVVSDTLPNGTVGTLVGPTGDGLTSGTLDTAEVWTYTISYAVTQADIDAGEALVNKAVVTTEELPTPEEDEATTPVGQTPSLTIVKTQVGGETTVTKPGNIDYEIVVTNTGNVSLTNVVVSDTLPNGTVGTLVGPTGDGLTSGTLDTAEVWTYTISYAVTQADIDAGEILVNKAVVTTEELPTPEEDEATTPVGQTPSLTIVKTQVGGETTVTEPGNIDYEIVVTNTGNVSLTNVVVSDTLPNGTVGTLVGPAGDGLTSGTLDTAEVWTYTISYAVTQADIDAGEALVNKAVVTTEELPTPEEDEATTPVGQTPSLTIVKTQVGGETTVTEPGNIDYEIVVTNTGNVSLTNVVVSDTLPNGTVGTLVGPTGDGLTSGTLDTAEVWTYTISYAVTQADIDAGEILVNKAVVTTEELPTPEEDEATTPVGQTPSLTIVKTQITGQNPVTSPSFLDYEIVVTNTGNVSLTNVVVSDTLPNGTVGTLVGPTGDGLTSGTLDTAEVWTYTISYAVTQADIDAGEALVNKAVVTTEELPTPEEDEATTPVGQTPSLTIVKTQVGGETTVTEPGNIDYEIVVTNTGNVSLTNVVVSDTLPNGTVGTLVGPTGDGLTSGTLDTAEVWTYTISYAVTQADIDAGEALVNKAVVTTEELPTPEEDEATTPVGQTPSLTIVKTQITGQNPVTSPSFLDYEIVVTNTGNVSLTNVVVSDTLPNGTVGTLVGPTGDGLTSGTLDTAEVWTYTISYAVTQADIDAGEALVNKAVVTTEELPTPEEDEATTPVSQTPSLTIVKTQVGGETTVTEPGNIDYEIVVTNTGNVSLTNVVVSDTLPNGTVGTLVGPTGDGLTSGTLDTAEVWTYTISYAVTQADIDAGEALVNKAVVTTEELPTPEEDEATTPVGQTPSLTIVKTQVGGETTVTKPGNIDYEIVVTNTGNVSLTNVVVSDTLPNGTVGTLVGPTGDGLTSGTLDTAEVWTYTISYAVTQADIDAGEILVNKAVVTTEELPTPEEDEATTPVGQTPSLTIVKTQVGGETTVTEPGNIDYEIVVTNTGNVSLTNVVVSDTLPNGTVGTLVGPAGDGLTSGTLDTAEVWTYTISYAVTQADIDAGEALVNKAVVTTEELPTPEEDEATTPVGQTPSLTIVKTQVGGETTVTEPGNIDYEIVVTNTGNVSLTNVVVSDTLPNGTVGTLVGPTGDGLTSGTLDTAEVWTYTISYAVTQADIDAGEILVNKAVVTTEELPTPEEDEATTPVGQTPSLTIVKTQVGGETTVTKPGNIDYEIVVTNTGNVSLTNVVVSDTLPNGTVGTLVGPAGDGLTSGTLDTAEVWTYTISYAVTQADIDAGEALVNKAVVTTEELPTPEEDEATTPVGQTPSLTIVKTQVGGETTVTEPGNIDYEIVVTNTGNVSLTNVVVSDTLPNGTVGTLVGPTGDGLTSGTLDTAEVWTYTISYAVTQADIDAGEILVNKAVVTTEELPTPEEDEATTPVGQTPSLTIVKTQITGQNPVTSPSFLDYEIVVTNTGNVSLTNVVVSDTLPNGTVGTLVGPTGDGLTSGTLDTAEVWTYTISYAVTQADIDAGEALVNKAVVTTEELPTPEEDEATTPVGQTPSLTIVKTQVGGETTVTEPGNIDYEIVVTNTGNVSLTNVVVSDTLPNGTVGTLVGPTGDGLTSGTLDTAEVWTYTISYAVTQADIDAGEALVNKAVVTTEELPTPEEDEATTPVGQTPSLTIVKTQVGGETTVTEPGNIDYEIVVTNTGNVSLTNVVVSDTLPNGTVGTLVGPTGDGLTSGTLDTAEVWTYTISYAVTQADIDAGEALVNKAVVTTEELPTPEEDEATTPVSQTPSLTIVKTQVGGETTVTEPGNIDYEIVVTNTGNVSLTNVVVSDTLPNGTVGTLVGPTGDGLTSGTLDTAEVWTYTISYAVTQADIDAGEALVNKAVVTTEELPTPEEDEATTPVSQTPSLTIVKTQVGGETTVTEPGNIDYEIVVTNTGNVSLTNVVVSDTLPNGTVGTLVGPTGDGLTSGTLDTAEVWTYTISYAVTQADIDAGEALVNKAVVTTEELPTPEEDEATTPVGQTPSLTIVKTQVGGETTVTKPGNIDYEIVVTNTGNVSLTNVVVSDTLPNGTVGTLVGPTGDGLTSGTLDTAEVWTYTISYAVTQADIDAGEILVNKAVVTTEELPTPEEDEATTPVGQTPSLTIVKTQVGGETTVTEPGNIDYEIVVTNTGNVSLTNVVVSDTLPNGTVGTLVGPAGDGLTSGTLDTAEVWTYTISYAVTQADIDAGEALVNKAVVTTEELPTPEEDEATTPVGQTPSLTIVKTQVGGETTVTEPGNIDYEIVVTNTGNVSLTNVVVSDTLPNGTVGTLVGPTGDGLTSGTLDTAEVWTYTISYAVTQADIDAGEILVNKAVVTTEELPTPEEDEATTPVGQTPSLTIVKTQITGQNPVTSPSFLDYEIVVTNTGNVSLTNVVVSDTLPNGTVGTLVGPTGDGLTSGTLDTAEVWTYTISYAVTQADIDAGEALVNKAVVTTEELPTPEEDEATTPVGQTPSLTIVKTQVGGETTVTEPGNIDYEIVVTNTGNVSLTNVVVSDTLPNGTVGTLVGPTGDGLTSGTLDTAEVWTYTISYAVTQADIDAGEALVNKAVVTTEELPTPEEDEATTPVGQTPSLTIVKTQITGQNPVTSPSFLDYEIVVTNTGNVSLTNVVVSDTLPNGTVGTLVGPTGDGLTSGTLDTAEVWTYTISYAVTQADIDAGEALVNKAVVTTEELPTPEEDEATTPVGQTPSLTIVKTQVGGETTVTEPGNIDYEIVVTNTGNVSLTNVVVSDTLPNGTVGTLVGPAGDGLTSGTLDTAEVWTYTISYAVTQADIDAGEILVNKAVVTTEELPTPEEDEATTPVGQTPSLTIVKTQITGQNPVTSPSFLDYEIVVTNTGNVSLTNVVVSDTLPNGTVGTLVGPTGDGLTSGTLDTAEVWTYTISYAVTQADIDAGEILVNKAVVTTEELPTPEEDEATTPVSQTPSLTIVKTQVGGETTVTEPGNIDYEIVVTNTGNVSLTNVVVSDTLPNGTVGTLVGPTGDGLTSGTLDTAEVWTYTISYAVTQADIDAGEILVNKAVVTTEELPTPEEDEATTPVGQTPSLTIVKTQVGGETTVTKPGNIDYEIVVTNTGNVSLTNVVVSDTLPNGTVGTLVGPTGDGLTSGTLDTAEVWTYTISYAVTQADIDAGEALVNKAVVTTEELPTPEEDEATTPVGPFPVLTLTKVADDTTKVYEGQVITYTYEVENIGNVTILDVEVTDVHEGSNPLGTITLQSTTGIDDGLDELVDSLAPGQTASWMSTYEVSEADIAAAKDIINVATATGTPTSGILIDPTAEEVLEIGQDVVAVDDEDLDNIVGTTVTLDIISNDTLSNSTNPIPTDITVDLDPATAGIQDTLIVGGEGTFVYDTLTGEVTFTPEVGFTTDPTPIVYNLIEDATGLDSTATITITYTEQPPVAVNDEDLDNVVGTTVTLDIIENDSLSDGSSIIDLTDITVDLDPATAGIQDTLIVGGEGTFVYDTLTGEVTFTPEVGFTTDPTPIVYNLIEDATGLDSTATITITYTEQPPVAVNDEDLDNVIGTAVTLDIIENDSLSDGSSIIDLTDITVDLDPATAGIQDTLIVGGEGTFVYDTLTGEVTFTPEVGFTTDPTPIVYNLIEDATGLDSTATITITYTEQPPVAVNDEDLDNVIGTAVTLDIIENDSLSDGSSIIDLTDITVDLDPATAGIQDTLIVGGEGTFVYDTLTGEVTFTPEVGFTTDPTPIVYNLIEDATGLDSTATITITYTEQPPVAVNDEDLDNVIGTTVTLDIIENDSLSDGSSIIDLTDITVDLDPTTAGIQDTLIVGGEGTFVYDTLTGEVTFTPEVGFTTDPTPIVYNLIEDATGLDSTATITITYTEQPPVAVNDEDLDNVIGTAVTLDIIENDSLSDGSSIIDLTDITVDLDPATAGIQDTLIVAGEGTFVYDTLTGEVTFTPEVGFTTDPTPIVYNLIEDATGLDSTATITITYTEQPPVAVNDEDLDNVIGTAVTLDIIENDSLSDGSSIIDLTDITVDLDPATAGIQDTLIVGGEGTFVYDTLTGEVTFTPEDTFYGQPTPIVYELVENETGLSDTAVITIMYQQTDLNLIKEVSTTEPRVGDVVTYSITVSNLGSDSVTNIYVKDYLPNGLINIENISGGGVMIGDTIIWGGFTLGSSADSVFTFNAEIAPLFDGVDYENFAEISDADGFDPNSTPGNLDEIPSEDDEDVVCAFIEQFESQYVLCEGGSITLAPLGTNAVNWTFEGNDVSTGDLIISAATIADSGSYFVTYTSSTGCSFTEEVLVIVNIIPEAVVTGVPAECLGATTLNNGHVIVVPTNGEATYQISEGTTFDEGTATSATPQAIPSDGVVIRDVANQVGGQSFTVRLFNSNGCSQDFVTVVPEANCNCPTAVCVPMTFKKTKSLK